MSSSIAVAQLHLLLVGGQEQEQMRLRHLLSKSVNGQVLLDNVRSPGERCRA
jgi:hypothetical protein